MISVENQPIQIFPDGSISWFYNGFLLILAFECCDDVCMKNMQMLILQCVLMIYGENSTHLDFARSSVLVLLQ